MFLQTHLSHPEIAPFVKGIAPGHFLFRQGELGHSMFVILDGIVQLYDESGERPCLVGTYGPGQFFGEKVMVTSSAHQRFFSAQARNKTMVLEFTLKDVPTIQRVVPDFMFVLFQASTQRLEKAYYLIRLLQCTDDLERLAHCILYFYRAPGIHAAINRTIPIAVDDIHFLIRMDKTRIQKCLDEFTAKGALLKNKDGTYGLRDLMKLLEIIPSLPQSDKSAA